MPAIVNLTAAQIQKAREALGDEHQLKDDATGQPRIATADELEQFGKAAYRRLWNNYDDRVATRERVRVPFDSNGS